MREITEIFDDIVNVCQDFCDENDFDVEIETDTCFQYFPKEKIVGITYTSNTQDKYFMDNAFKMGLSYDCGAFILSLMHEIGHHFTLDKIPRRKNRVINAQKAGLNGWSKKDNYKYFKVLDEILATEWAISFINNNKELLNDFVDELLPLFDEIVLD